MQNTAGANELRFYDVDASSSVQTIAVFFSQPVTDLTLSFIDVDASTNYNDRVIVNTPLNIGASLGSNVRGSGTSASPTAPHTTAVADGDGVADLGLTWAVRSGLRGQRDLPAGHRHDLREPAHRAAHDPVHPDQVLKVHRPH